MQPSLDYKNSSRQPRVSPMKYRCSRICFVIVLSVVLAMLSQVDYLARNTSKDDAPYNPNVLKVRNQNPSRYKDESNNVHNDPSSFDKDESSNVTNGNDDTISQTVSPVRPLTSDNQSSSSTKLDLDDMVDPKSMQVKVDVSDIIDFAIVGNPKTGTTFLVEWMRTHPDLLL